MEWKKIENNMIEWDQEGKELIGEYLGFESSPKLSNPVHKINTGDETVSFFGTTMLNSLLIGLEKKFIKIVYLGDKDTGKANKLKMFEVFIKE